LTEVKSKVAIHDCPEWCVDRGETADLHEEEEGQPAHKSLGFEILPDLRPPDVGEDENSWVTACLHQSSQAGATVEMEVWPRGVAILTLTETAALVAELSRTLAEAATSVAGGAR
jgi:hypothetical protein